MREGLRLCVPDECPQGNNAKKITRFFFNKEPQLALSLEFLIFPENFSLKVPYRVPYLLSC